jgi:hypothetical protein
MRRGVFSERTLGISHTTRSFCIHTTWLPYAGVPLGCWVPGAATAALPCALHRVCHLGVCSSLACRVHWFRVVIARLPLWVMLLPAWQPRRGR